MTTPAARRPVFSRAEFYWLTGLFFSVAPVRNRSFDSANRPACLSAFARLYAALFHRRIFCGSCSRFRSGGEARFALSRSAEAQPDKDSFYGIA